MKQNNRLANTQQLKLVDTNFCNYNFIVCDPFISCQFDDERLIANFDKSLSDMLIFKACQNYFKLELFISITEWLSFLLRDSTIKIIIINSHQKQLMDINERILILLLIYIHFHKSFLLQIAIMQNMFINLFTEMSSRIQLSRKSSLRGRSLKKENQEKHAKMSLSLCIHKSESMSKEIKIKKQELQTYEKNQQEMRGRILQNRQMEEQIKNQLDEKRRTQLFGLIKIHDLQKLEKSRAALLNFINQLQSEKIKINTSKMHLLLQEKQALQEQIVQCQRQDHKFLKQKQIQFKQIVSLHYNNKRDILDKTMENNISDIQMKIINKDINTNIILQDIFEQRLNEFIEQEQQEITNIFLSAEEQNKIKRNKINKKIQQQESWLTRRRSYNLQRIKQNQQRNELTHKQRLQNQKKIEQQKFKQLERDFEQKTKRNQQEKQKIEHKLKETKQRYNIQIEQYGNELSNINIKLRQIKSKVFQKAQNKFRSLQNQYKERINQIQKRKQQLQKKQRLQQQSILLLKQQQLNQSSKLNQQQNQFQKKKIKHRIEKIKTKILQLEIDLKQIKQKIALLTQEKMQLNKQIDNIFNKMLVSYPLIKGFEFQQQNQQPDYLYKHMLEQMKRFQKEGRQVFLYIQRCKNQYQQNLSKYKEELQKCIIKDSSLKNQLESKQKDYKRNHQIFQNQYEEHKNSLEKQRFQQEAYYSKQIKNINDKYQQEKQKISDHFNNLTSSRRQKYFTHSKRNQYFLKYKQEYQNCLKQYRESKQILSSQYDNKIDQYNIKINQQISMMKSKYRQRLNSIQNYYSLQNINDAIKYNYDELKKWKNQLLFMDQQINKKRKVKSQYQSIVKAIKKLQISLNQKQIEWNQLQSLTQENQKKKKKSKNFLEELIIKFNKSQSFEKLK